MQITVRVPEGLVRVSAPFIVDVVLVVSLGLSYGQGYRDGPDVRPMQVTCTENVPASNKAVHVIVGGSRMAISGYVSVV